MNVFEYVDSTIFDNWDIQSYGSYIGILEHNNVTAVLNQGAKLTIGEEYTAKVETGI